MHSKSIKCVVWDLDNTLWHGTLLEGDHINLRDGMPDIIQALDRRGILQSIASRNDPKMALDMLRSFRLDAYFLYPQINWNSKAASVKAIANSLNIGLDSIAFIDDQPFELEEVRFSLPDVLCMHASYIEKLLDMPELTPRFVTSESQLRRAMYLGDIERNRSEAQFTGPQEEFLATLQMICTISQASEQDLQRAEELTVRTNQLNTTGHTYSYEDLDYFRISDRYRLLIVSLDDKYGTYGKIGLALIECAEHIWTIKLLLMSCRVMSRGVGTILINHILHLASAQNVSLRADFIANDRNRMMYITYKFMGFKECEKHGNLTVLAHSLTSIQPFPDYVKVHILE